MYSKSKVLHMSSTWIFLSLGLTIICAEIARTGRSGWNRKNIEMVVGVNKIQVENNL